jgi:hypothetical protein
MDIAVRQLPEPALEFGGGVLGVDPKRTLGVAGPFGCSSLGASTQLPLGIVAFPEEVESIRKWLERMHSPIISDESNALRYGAFPGLPTAFRAGLEVSDRFIRHLDHGRYARIMAEAGHGGFNALLHFYEDAISSLFGDERPVCILVGFPEEVARLRVSNPRLTYQEQQILQRLQRDDEANQMMLFEPSVEEKRVAAELMPQSEELLFRSFHRALKARCMNLPNPVPLQIIRRQTYISREAKQSDATRAWNLSTALYYKSGHIPWRPSGLTKSTCFIGLSFHHLKRRSGDLVYASVAQAFSTEVEPFTLKGASVPYDQTTVDKRPYLKADQASRLISEVLLKYSERAGSVPSRVVVHKTSRYQPEERIGFRETALSEVADCDLVWLGPTGFRLLRRGMREPLRGTLCTIAGDNSYLFTTGYVPWWDEYPGPHIPSPMEIGTANDTSVEERCREILSLTKMNWNTADGIGRNPITIAFARRVGMIMTELEEDEPPNPLFRFYM